MPGLEESVRGIWNGDVNLNNGELEKQYNEYCHRLQSIKGLKLEDMESLNEKLDCVVHQVQSDLEFLHKGESVIAIIVIDCVTFMS